MDTTCNNRDPKTGFFCSKKPGHGGKHGTTTGSGDTTQTWSW